MEQRIFIVGSPRSGTTLLQAILASHSGIVSFPETHFFSELLDHRSWLRRSLCLSSKKMYDFFENFLSKIERSDLGNFITYRGSNLSKLTKQYVDLLDTIAEEKKCKIWLEKTPKHLFYIDYIASNISNARFIHLIRDGQSAVASLYDVSQRFEGWPNWTLEQCLDKWNSSIRESLRYVDCPNHYFVSYEELVSNPQQTVSKLCEILGVNFSPNMLVEFSESMNALIQSDEQWKMEGMKHIDSSKSNKFDRIFNQQQKSLIDEQTCETQELVSKLFSSKSA